MPETPDMPIKDAHAAFAQELVALARRHGANNLTVQFSLSGSQRPFVGLMEVDRWDMTPVKFEWREGRHGDRQSMALRAEIIMRIEEAAPKGDQADDQ